MRSQARPGPRSQRLDNAAMPAGGARTSPLLVRFWPLLLFWSYLTITVVLFALGPIDYPITNPRRLYGFLAAAHIALVLGYAAVPYRIPDAMPRPGDAWMFSVRNLILVSATLNIGLLIPSTLFTTGGSFDVVGALANPNAAYTRAYRSSINSTNPFVYAIMFVAPLMGLVVPLTLFYWRKLDRLTRYVAITAITVIFASAAMLGRNKGFADLVILIVVFGLVHVFRSRQQWSRRRWLTVTAAGLAVVMLFFVFFSVGSVRRGGRTARGYVPSIGGYLDFDNAFLAPFPSRMRPGVGLFYGYLTQGYYGLSLSLQVDFVWSRGLGNSFFLHIFEERFLGSEYARENCYPARVEQQFGYSMLGHWHSIYPWIASDLTFPGTVAFVFLIGALLAMTWFDTLAGINPFAVAMFANLCLMLFYFNANNQALAFPVQFCTTMGTLVLWLFTRWRLR